MTPPPAEHFAARVFLGPTLRAQPDRRLVDLVRDGYDAAFEEIVRRYRRPLDRFAAAIVGGRSEDVTQDAFSKALLALRGTEAEIELRPWLYRIVRNTALNDLRDREPVAEELNEATPGARSVAAEAESRQEMRDLMQRLQALPESQRAALVMRELEGLSHEEIAAALGVSGGAARQAIFRARAALRDGFGLLVPMPVLRMLAEHGDDVARAGGAIAGAGASTAGGAALGGGALKVGVATVLVAGTVGAGVAIGHHRGGHPGPEAAEAATLATPRAGGRQSPSGSGSAAGNSGRRGAGGGDDSGSGARHGEGQSRHDSGITDGSSGGSGHSGGSSDDDHSGHGGRGPSSGSGSGDNSGPGSRHSGGDDGSSGSGSGSGSDGGGGSSGSAPGSGDDGSGSGGGGDSSGPGSGEVENEPTPTTPEAEVEDGGGSGSGSSGKDSGSGSGSGDLSSSETSGSDGSP